MPFSHGAGGNSRKKTQKNQHKNSARSCPEEKKTVRGTEETPNYHQTHNTRPGNALPNMCALLERRNVSEQPSVAGSSLHQTREARGVRHTETVTSSGKHCSMFGEEKVENRYNIHPVWSCKVPPSPPAAQETKTSIPIASRRLSSSG